MYVERNLDNIRGRRHFYAASSLIYTTTRATSALLATATRNNVMTLCSDTEASKMQCIGIGTKTIADTNMIVKWPKQFMFMIRF